MSTVARIPVQVANRHAAGLADITAAIKSADSIEDLKEARARIEAMKAWAKVHNLTKQLRLDLLIIEVEALVRIVELDGADTLSAMDRQAAEYLAAMKPADRIKFVHESRQATTAAGLCRSVWREDEIKRERQNRIVIGRQLAEEPTPPVYDEEAIKMARDYANGIQGVLEKITADYIECGEEFTIEEITDQIMADSMPDDMVEDDAIRKGVSEVVREAVRRSPVLTFNGTSIPRVITARNEGKYIRIPTMNATVAHLDDMILMREQQIEQDQIKLDKLKVFAKALREYPGGNEPQSRIGALISASITNGDAK
jgi:hypothetical protein